MILALTLALDLTLTLTTDPNLYPDPNPYQVLGPPADIYSLGVILFELLSGKKVADYAAQLFTNGHLQMATYICLPKCTKGTDG